MRTIVFNFKKSIRAGKVELPEAVRRKEDAEENESKSCAELVMEVSKQSHARPGAAWRGQG